MKVLEVVRKRTGRFLLRAILGAGFLSLLTAAAVGDYVILRNGQRLNGLVVVEDEREVHIETVGGLVRLDRDKVDHVEKQATAENLRLSARLALRRPDFLQASQLLKRSLKLGADPAEVRQTIAEASTAFLDRLAYISRTEKNEWLALCNDLSHRGQVDPDWTYLRGEMGLAMGDGKAALEAWSSLGGLYFATHEKERERVGRWAMRRIEHAVNQRRFDECVDLLDLLGVLDPQRAQSCRIIVLLHSARTSIDNGNYAQACRIYAEELMPLEPAIAKVPLRQTLESQCEHLLERRQYEEAISLLRRYGRPHLPELAGRLLARAYRGKLERYLIDGRTDMARGLLVEAGEYFDDAELEELKNTCMYHERRTHLAPDDYGGHYELALELAGMGMDGAAIEEFVMAGRSPKLKDLADRQIALIRKGQQETMMQRIIECMNVTSPRYLEALDLIDEFRREFPDSDWSTTATTLAQQAHAGAVKEERVAEDLAETRLAHAQRLLRLGREDEALELLDRLLRDHPTVRAAPEARRVKREILKARQIRRLEETMQPKADQPRSVASGSPLLPDLAPGELDAVEDEAFKAAVENVLKQLQF